MAENTRWIEVVGGILWRGESFLAAQRPEGHPQAGFWEFPGGKVEPGETLEAALSRELAEELSLSVRHSHFWRTVEHDYGFRAVRLHFFHITEFSGEPAATTGRISAGSRPKRPAPCPSSKPTDRCSTSCGVRRKTFGNNAPNLLSGSGRCFLAAAPSFPSRAQGDGPLQLIEPRLSRTKREVRSLAPPANGRLAAGILRQRGEGFPDGKGPYPSRTRPFSMTYSRESGTASRIKSAMCGWQVKYSS